MVRHLVIPSKAWDSAVRTATVLILRRTFAVETTGLAGKEQHVARFVGLAPAPCSASLAADPQAALDGVQ